MIRLKRVYEVPESKDGYRILVDRVWPRGITRERAHIREWVKETAPTTALRKWFGHDPKKWDGFRRRYLQELKTRQTALKEIKKKSARETVTLVYGARDPEHNHAVVLKQVLDRMKGS